MAFQELIAKDVIANSGIAFGTSGARGLIEDFSIDVCRAFTFAFIDSLQEQVNSVAIAIDNRPSSYEIARACALSQLGLRVIYYGVIPTPALAYKAITDGHPSLMVTGSHIPFDRNGLKFFRPDGEISKSDEEAILTSQIRFDDNFLLSELEVDTSAAQLYKERYTSLFTNTALKGKKIGIYEHSSAGREIYRIVFEQMGAEVITLERTDYFVPIDTEAVSNQDRQKALAWSSDYDLDVIFSTDGDGDRPLIADEKGHWLRGDILGLLCAKALKIESVAIPVSCNTAIERSDIFKKVMRTKIGSPYVIEKLSELSKEYSSVAGFEANGGFLLGSDITINSKLLSSLPTRDALLPAIMVLTSLDKGTISEQVIKLPSRYTASDRLSDFENDKSEKILNEWKESPQKFLSNFILENISISDVNITDGLRLSLSNGDVIHLRPSGNAPEMRCYTESDSESRANLLVSTTLEIVKLIKNQIS